MFGSHLQGDGTRSSIGTVTVIAAVGAGVRWSLTKGLITVFRGTGVATFDLMETDADATQSATLISISASAPMVLPLDFGEHGYHASETNSRLAAQISSSEAGVHSIFVGYKR